MFSGFKYRMAKNMSINMLEHFGEIDQTTAKLMRKIAYYPTNSIYGVELIKSGSVRNKYAAAAAVFARLYLAAKRESTRDDITAEHWQGAGIHAMRLSGASGSEALPVFSELVSIIEQSEMAADKEFFDA